MGDTVHHSGRPGPGAADSAAADPAAADPAAADPAAADLEATDLEAADPAAPDTAAADPGAADLEATDPAAADPAATDPGATDPGAADLEAARGAASRSGDPYRGDLAVSVVGRLFRLAPRLMELQDLGARQYGLGFARGRVLWALAESGPVLMRALSQALGISPRTVTGLIDALEADGWVTRSAHPADRRATIISLAPAAEATLARLRDSYEGLAHDLLGDLPEDDLVRCRTVITILEERLDDAASERVAAFGPATGPRPQAPQGRR
jgi:DNA-binding MarR family transcriptional regulator